jgi:hypothetical protein
MEGPFVWQERLIVTARRAALIWTKAENLHNWIWDLYVVIWSPQQNVLHINGSSNAGESNALAQAVTNNQAAIIKGQEVFRSFAGINRLRLHSVGLTDQIGRNVRYTGSMVSNVEPRLTRAQLGSSLKTVLDGTQHVGKLLPIRQRKLRCVHSSSYLICAFPCCGNNDAPNVRPHAVAYRSHHV